MQSHTNQRVPPMLDTRALHQPASTYSIFLYWPNVIGYVRLGFVLTSLFMATTNWKISMFCYTMAFIGDAVDGFVARRCRQVTQFGAMLDIITDRCSTTSLYFVLTIFYSDWVFAFILFTFLDLFAHWMHTYSVKGHGHHKAAATLRNSNIVIRFFYECYPFFAFCCVGTEFFFIFLYLLHFIPEAAVTVAGFSVTMWQACFYVCLPAVLCKNVVNVATLAAAAYRLAEEDYHATFQVQDQVAKCIPQSPDASSTRPNTPAEQTCSGTHQKTF